MKSEPKRLEEYIRIINGWQRTVIHRAERWRNRLVRHRHRWFPRFRSCHLFQSALEYVTKLLSHTTRVTSASFWPSLPNRLSTMTHRYDSIVVCSKMSKNKHSFVVFSYRHRQQFRLTKNRDILFSFSKEVFIAATSSPRRYDWLRLQLFCRSTSKKTKNSICKERNRK